MIDIVKHFFRDIESIRGYMDEGTDFECPFDTDPWEWLDFAAENLKKESPHANADALSNTKRALDCELDFFIHCYGLANIAKVPPWATGRKIRLASDLGLAPESILQRLNAARNQLEHHYEMPSPITASNAHEIVTLFVTAVDLFLYPTRVGTMFHPRSSHEDSEGLHLRIVHEESMIYVECPADGTIDGLGIRASDSLDEYLYLLGFILHSQRLYAKNPAKFFRRLKYYRRFHENDQSDAPNEDEAKHP